MRVDVQVWPVIVWRVSLKRALAVLGVCLFFHSAGFGQSAQWWEQYKAACRRRGGRICEYYNQCNGVCTMPSAAPEPTVVPADPEALVRQQVQFRIAAAKVVIGNEDYARAIELLREAGGLAPSNEEVAELLRTANQLLADQEKLKRQQQAAEAERRRVEAVNQAIAAALAEIGGLGKSPDPDTHPPGFDSTAGVKQPPGFEDRAKLKQPPGFESPAGAGTSSFDPRTLITANMYRAATAELSKLEKQKSAFQKQAEQVRRWEKGLRQDNGEFEAMRREAQEGLVYEFLDHAPVGWELEELDKSGYLTENARAKIEMGWEALKGLVNTERGVTATEDSERIGRVVDGNIALRKAMVAIAKGQIPVEGQHWLKGFGLVYDASAKLFAIDAKNNKSREDWANLFVDLGEVIVPVSGIPILVQHGAIRYAKYWSARNAQASLADALSRHWDAQRYWSGKLETLDQEIAENEQLVRGYKAIHHGSH